MIIWNYHISLNYLYFKQTKIPLQIIEDSHKTTINKVDLLDVTQSTAH